MIRITSKAECCGCNACGDVCSRHAITFQADTEGFWYPLVDEAKCSDCGLCEKVCPIINAASLKRNDFEKPACYAAQNKNLEVLFDSSSGGVFSALAGVMYKKGGFVGGAVFNADFSVSHFISNDKHDLPRLRSAKWCQSSLEGFFLSVRKILDSGGGYWCAPAPAKLPPSVRF